MQVVFFNREQELSDNVTHAHKGYVKGRRTQRIGSKSSISCRFRGIYQHNVHNKSFKNQTTKHFQLCAISYKCT